MTKLVEVEGRIADLRVVAGTLRAAVDAGWADLVACATSVECPIPFDDPSGRGQLGGRRAGPVSVGRR